MPAIAWWLWLYAGISNCPGLYRQPCQPDLCRYQRNYERTDCTFTVNWTHKKESLRTPFSLVRYPTLRDQTRFMFDSLAVFFKFQHPIFKRSLFEFLTICQIIVADFPWRMFTLFWHHICGTGNIARTETTHHSIL